MARASSLLLCPKGFYDIRIFAIIVCQYRVILLFLSSYMFHLAVLCILILLLLGAVVNVAVFPVIFAFVFFWCFIVCFSFSCHYIYIYIVCSCYVCYSCYVCSSCSYVSLMFLFFLFSYCYCFVGLPLVVPACVCFMCVDIFSWSFFFSCSLLHVFCFENSNTLRIHVFPEKSYPKYFLRRQLDP